MHDLAPDNTFKDKIISIFTEGNHDHFDKTPIKMFLEQKGFNVKIYESFPKDNDKLDEALNEADQVWIISNSSETFFTEDKIDILEKHFINGKSLYLMSDNSPFGNGINMEANAIAKRLFDINISSCKESLKTVHHRGDTSLETVGLKNHPVNRNVEGLIEGCYLSKIEINDRNNENLKPVLVAHNGSLAITAFDNYQTRALIDCGWDRYGSGMMDKQLVYDKLDTERFIKNVACWLAGAE